MKPLCYEDMRMIAGQAGVTLTGALLYVAVAAGVSAIIKILTSGKGRVRLPGIQMEWNG